METLKEKMQEHKLSDGFVIHGEDIIFLKKIREINFGDIEKVTIVNGRVQMFKKPKESVKIF